MLELYRLICSLWDKLAGDDRKGTRLSTAIVAVMIWLTMTIIQVIRILE